LEDGIQLSPLQARTVDSNSDLDAKQFGSTNTESVAVVYNDPEEAKNQTPNNFDNCGVVIVSSSNGSPETDEK
jgi:hypothetical protein